jgi:hypothetical protein
MPTYDEAKLNAFTAVTTVTVVGVPLDVSDDHPLRHEGYQPIKGCICVTEPCPCDEESSEILWILSPRGDAQGIATDKKNEAGEVLYNYRLDADVTIVIESYERIRVSDLISTRRRMPSPSNARNRITVSNRFNLGLQPRAATCPPAILDSDPGGHGLGVWVLVGEDAEYCTYEYAGGIA